MAATNNPFYQKYLEVKARERAKKEQAGTHPSLPRPSEPQPMGVALEDLNHWRGDGVDLTEEKKKWEKIQALMKETGMSYWDAETIVYGSRKPW